jgi:hypothetical protein
MAIHKDYPGLKVEIVVNDKALPEYEDPDIECKPNEVVRYVEAEAGAEFAIRYNYDKTLLKDHDLGEDAYVDGQPIQKNFTKKGTLVKSSPIYICTVERELDGCYTEQTLHFGELATSESFLRKRQMNEKLIMTSSGRSCMPPSQRPAQGG